MKRDCQSLKILLTGSRQDKFTQLQIHTGFHEKGKMTQWSQLTYSASRYLPIPPHLGYFLWVLPLSNLVSSPNQDLFGCHPYIPDENPTMLQPPYLVTTQIPALTYLKKFLGVFDHKSHPIV